VQPSEKSPFKSRFFGVAASAAAASPLLGASLAASGDPPVESAVNELHASPARPATPKATPANAMRRMKSHGT
jgi:hypothetical protein